MNVCLVSKRFPTAGFLWAVAQGLVLHGHKVTILTQRSLASSLSWSLENVTVFGLGDPRVLGVEFSQLVFNRFMELHAKEPFDVIHSIDGSGVMIGQKKRLFKVAVVYDVNATGLGGLYSILGSAQETTGSLIRTTFSVVYNFLKNYYNQDRAIIRTADAIFVHSPQQRMALERYYLYPDSRIFTVPFGLRIEDLSPRQKSIELLKKLGFPQNAQVVVTISDMIDKTEMSYVLRAFEKVAVKKPAARLIVIGQGPAKREIEFEMLNLVLGSRVVFVGELSSAATTEHVALADVFVNLSARSSDIDQSLLEAMAQGKVIIGSEVSPIATVVEDGVDGFLIRPADTTTLAELMLQTFNSQIKIAEIGEKARQKVLNLFDSKKMIDQTLAAYRISLKRSGYGRSKTQRIESVKTDSVTARSL